MERNGILRLVIGVLVIALAQGCTLSRVDPPCPGIEGIVPAAAQYGDTVSIKGTNFIAGLPQLYKITIGSEPIPVLDVPDVNTIRFTVPLGIGDGPVSVSVNGSSCTMGASPGFTYRFTVTQVQQVAAGFNQPAGMAVDGNGNIILADRSNDVIKLVTPQGGISIIAGQSGTPGTTDNNNGPFVNFNFPQAVAVDAAGNIYVADDYNYCIRKIINPPSYYVSTAAGLIGVAGEVDGSLTAARFSDPTGLAISGTDSLYVIENTSNRLRFVNFQDGSVTTLMGGGATSPLNYPLRVAYSQMRNAAYPILVADQDNNRILEVSTTGTANATPIGLTFPPHDLALDDNGNIFVLNGLGGRVSVIYKDNGIVDIAGVGINYNFQSVSGIAVDSKNKVAYVSDDALSNIVMIRYQ